MSKGKNFLRIVLLVFIATCLSLCLVACNKDENDFGQPSHKHLFEEWEVISQPTCTNNGTKKRVCSECNYEELDAIPATEHIFEEWEIIKQATCTNIGIRNRKCSNCDYKEHASIPTNNKHLYDEYEQCINCGIGLVYKYDENSDTYSITGYTGKKNQIVIPSYYQNKKVTAIDRAAFFGCSILTSISIPDSVMSIGWDAFYGCNNLRYNKYNGAYYLGNNNNPYLALISAISEDITSCEIHENTTIIGCQAFISCRELTSITIPAGVKNIGLSAFGGCTKLSNIFISDLLKWCEINFESIDANPLAYANSLYLNGKLIIGETITELTIPDNVTKINSCAFYNCNQLISITIPDSVTKIGWSAFRQCTNLLSVNIPDSVTTIDAFAFEECYGLTSITLGTNVISIGELAFKDCYRLVEIYNKTSLDITVGSENFGYVGYYAKIINAIDNASKLANVNGFVIYDDTTLINYIGNESTIIIPHSVENINSYALFNHKTLTSITITNNVTSIGDDAFNGCSALTTIDWNAIECTTIGRSNHRIFSSTNLTTLNIGEDVASIPSGAFDGCNKLETVNWNAIECSIVGNLNIPIFNNCINLTTVNIGDNVTKIPSRAFYGCSKLKNITISDRVTSIGDEAFFECSSLMSIVIPSSISSIERGAFLRCTSLESIIFMGTKAQWQAISKYSAWNVRTGNFTVHCTDGDLDKDGNEI